MVYSLKRAIITLTPTAAISTIAGIDNPVVTAIGAAATALIAKDVPAVNGAAATPAPIKAVNAASAPALNVVIFLLRLIL